MDNKRNTIWTPTKAKITTISLYPVDDWMIGEIARMMNLPGQNIRTAVIRKAVRRLYDDLKRSEER